MIAFLLILFLSAIGFMLCYFLFSTPLFLLAGAGRIIHEKLQPPWGRILTYLIHAVIFLGFALLMLFWGAYLAALTVAFAHGKSFAFLYHMAGFFCCATTLAGMTAPDRHRDSNAAVGTLAYILIAVLAYVFCSIFPAMNLVQL